MALKTNNSNITTRVTSGFSIVELILVLGVLIILFAIVVLFLDPREYRKRARDETRVSDAMILSRIVEEYILDHGVPPDTDQTLRQSNVLPAGNLGPLMSTTT